LDKRTTKRPATELAIDWLARNRPLGPEALTTLVHGDYRVGNFLVAPEGLTGVLDWEFAHWGSPDEDLAWLCMRDWRFGKLSLPVGGIGPRAPFLRAYAEASGRVPDPASLRWWEIYGNCRWAVGTEEQAERYTQHGTKEIELAAIGRRGAEMEWEALRLIDLAVPPEPKRESTIPPSMRAVRGLEI
jgi:aminoglycoside phosphotransferase (APT) family kinase protein